MYVCRRARDVPFFRRSKSTVGIIGSNLLAAIYKHAKKSRDNCKYIKKLRIAEKVQETRDLEDLRST